MSVISTILNAIANGIVNGISTLVNIIVNGIISAVQSVLTGIQNLIGVPLSIWETATSEHGLTIPIVFTLSLGIAGFVAFVFIDAYGLENDLGNDLVGAMEEI